MLHQQRPPTHLSLELDSLQIFRKESRVEKNQEKREGDLQCTWPCKREDEHHFFVVHDSPPQLPSSVSNIHHLSHSFLRLSLSPSTSLKQQRRALQCSGQDLSCPRFKDWADFFSLPRPLHYTTCVTCNTHSRCLLSALVFQPGDILAACARVRRQTKVLKAHSHRGSFSKGSWHLIKTAPGIVSNGQIYHYEDYRLMPKR